MHRYRTADGAQLYMPQYTIVLVAGPQPVLTVEDCARPVYSQCFLIPGSPFCFQRIKFLSALAQVSQEERLARRGLSFSPFPFLHSDTTLIVNFMC